MRHIVPLPALVLVLSFVIATPVTAQAGIITFDYTGRITGISDPIGDFVGAAVGDLVFGAFSYDTQAPGAGNETITSYHFNDQPGNFNTIDVNGRHLEDNGAYSLDVYNDFALTDLVTIYGVISGSYAPDGSTWAWILSFESLSDPLNSTDLPLSYSIADWSEGVRGAVVHTLQPTGPSSVVNFDVVDVRPRPVPETSSSLLLLATSLAGLVASRRRLRGPRGSLAIAGHPVSKWAGLGWFEFWNRRN